MLFYCYSIDRLGRLNPCKPHLNAKRMLTSCLLFRACLGTKYFCGFNTEYHGIYAKRCLGALEKTLFSILWYCQYHGIFGVL